MEKYSVDQEREFIKKASKEHRCPECGSELEKTTPQLKCPNCGTKPFEKRRADEQS